MLGKWSGRFHVPPLEMSALCCCSSVQCASQWNVSSKVQRRHIGLQKRELRRNEGIRENEGKTKETVVGHRVKCIPLNRKVHEVSKQVQEMPAWLMTGIKTVLKGREGFLQEMVVMPT